MDDCALFATICKQQREQSCEDDTRCAQNYIVSGSKLTVSKIVDGVEADGVRFSEERPALSKGQPGEEQAEEGADDRVNEAGGFARARGGCCGGVPHCY